MPLVEQNSQGGQEIEVNVADIHGVYDDHKFDRIAFGLREITYVAWAEMPVRTSQDRSPFKRSF